MCLFLVFVYLLSAAHETITVRCWLTFASSLELRWKIESQIIHPNWWIEVMSRKLIDDGWWPMVRWIVAHLSKHFKYRACHNVVLSYLCLDWVNSNAYHTKLDMFNSSPPIRGSFASLHKISELLELACSLSGDNYICVRRTPAPAYIVFAQPLARLAIMNSAFG